MKKVVAFVPIKTNNERLPGKNTKKFSNGKPLISYILDTLVRVEMLDEIYVYCSDPSIKEYLPAGVIFLERDKYLDLSTTSFNEVLTTFANKVHADIYVLTHATAPFISVKTFEKAITALKSGEYDSALSVERLQEFFWKDGVPLNYDPVKIPRTQDLIPYYIETCGMYAYTSKLIKDEGRRVGHHPFLVEVSKKEACDINNPEDFVIADALTMFSDNI
ncbi:MAG: acylneuraminate cytidylyltransferase family protein [Lachnospiraceae bacterium]|nr:acylneuraminate cytidylyltransferase family protein [Lachnospiraceae bacterium]